jgi:hypothetical protein
MTTINEYLNRNKPAELVEVKSLDEARKLYPEIKTWVDIDDEEALLRAIINGEKLK